MSPRRAFCNDRQRSKKRHISSWLRSSVLVLRTFVFIISIIQIAFVFWPARLNEKGETRRGLNEFKAIREVIRVPASSLGARLSSTDAMYLRVEFTYLFNWLRTLAFSECLSLAHSTDVGPHEFRVSRSIWATIILIPLISPMRCFPGNNCALRAHYTSGLGIAKGKPAAMIMIRARMLRHSRICNLSMQSKPWKQANMHTKYAE